MQDKDGSDNGPDQVDAYQSAENKNSGPLLVVCICRLLLRMIAMPARMIVLLLIMSGDVEENPGPGMEELLDCVCSTEHLNKIAATFNYDWRAVGRCLVEASDVEDVDREGHSEQEKRDKMFEVWMKRKGSEATYRKLMNSFTEVHNQLAAEMVNDLLTTAKDSHETVQTTPSSISSFPSEITAGDIILNEKDVIGAGAQGCVYKALWKVKQKEVAVKKIHLLTNAAKREIETLRSVRHKNVVTLYGVYEITSHTLCLVLELADTSLDQYLKRSTPNFKSSLKWAEDVAQGLYYLHFGVPEPIIHGDLKSPNVLVYSDGVLKIGDFGSSKFQAGQQSSRTRMTIEWTAPELFDEGKHSMESDVYSFGILLWEIVTHEVPYKGLTALQVMNKVNKNQRPIIPSSCHEVLRGVIQRCWDGEPKNRPSFTDVLKSFDTAKNESKVAGETKKDPSVMTGDKNQIKSKPIVESEVSRKYPSVMTEPSTQPLSELISQMVEMEGTPTLLNLLSFSDRRVNIAEQIGYKYLIFGIFLLNDSNGAIVNAIENEHQRNAERINVAILQRWLRGIGVMPMTWSTLVTVLQKIGM